MTTQLSTTRAFGWRFTMRRRLSLLAETTPFQETTLISGIICNTMVTLMKSLPVLIKPCAFLGYGYDTSETQYIHTNVGPGSKGLPLTITNGDVEGKPVPGIAYCTHIS